MAKNLTVVCGFIRLERLGQVGVIDELPLLDFGVGELGYDDLRVRSPKNNTSQNAELMQCPECLKMYVNGLGFRAIGRVKNVHHTTIINWVKQVGKLLPDFYEPEITPQVGELDELETFVGSKKIKPGYGQQ